MAHIPNEPEAFGEYVVRAIKRLSPDSSVELVNVSVVALNGDIINIANLRIEVGACPDLGAGDHLIECFAKHVIDSQYLMSTPLPFEFVRGRIMPRIRPENVFEYMDRESFAHVEFVNGTVVMFAIDLPNAIVYIKVEDLIRWGIDVDETQKFAIANLDKHSQIEFESVKLPSGNGEEAVRLSICDDYNASRLLSGRTRRELLSFMGSEIFVAIPTRGCFFACRSQPRELSLQLKRRARREASVRSHAICDRLFVVTHDGVAGTEPDI